jgi:hypothetical protein
VTDTKWAVNEEWLNRLAVALGETGPYDPETLPEKAEALRNAVRRMNDLPVLSTIAPLNDWREGREWKGGVEEIVRIRKGLAYCIDSIGILTAHKEKI